MQWLTPINQATWEAEMERITIWEQPRQKVIETHMSRKKLCVVVAYLLF
jgi:hypothetical protein